MIYNVINYFSDWLHAHDYWGFVRVFTYVEFRALFAIILSFALVIAAGPRVIAWLRRQKIGDNPEFYNDKINELTKAKGGTPTMGGALISGAIFLTTVLLADLSPSKGYYVLMGLICLIWLCCVGLWDDWMKLSSIRRAAKSPDGKAKREGLFSHEKLLFQIGLGVILGLLVHHYGTNKFTIDVDHVTPMTHSLNLPLLKSWVWNATDKIFVPSPSLIVLPAWAFVILTVIVITGSSNAVNLTDGMDGLAAGTMGIVSFAFMILCLIAGEQTYAQYLLLPYIPQSDELAIIAGAVCGACLGFLWFNANPAKVFMGDTGSLPLGGLIGYIAVVIRQEFLLVIIGGIFVLEAISVMMQVGYFKWTKGKRIFLMAPIHHHFHLLGWSEQQVVTRFWIITIVLAVIAVATLKIR